MGVAGRRGLAVGIVGLLSGRITEHPSTVGYCFQELQPRCHGEETFIIVQLHEISVFRYSPQVCSLDSRREVSARTV